MFRKLSMRSIAVYILFAMLSFVFSHTWGAETERAKADLFNAQGRKVGNAVFEEDDRGVHILVKVNRMPPGEHALHIHEAGRSGLAAGKHFNPFSRQHGFLNPRGPHAGDLPNLVVDRRGRGTISVTTRLVTLKAGAKNTLLGSNGTMLVIREGRDDYVSDPSDAGGGRNIASGKIEPVP